MSSHDETQKKSAGGKVKRRRIGRACDMCRLKKIRCDGQQGPGQKCSNCAIYDDECTFVQDAPKRQSRPRGYVQRLEARVAAMEALLTKLCPASNFSQEVEILFNENSRLVEASDFEDSESSGEDIEAEAESVIGHIGRGRASRSKEDRDRFTYAVPPAFSPSLPQHSTSGHYSPDGSGFSTTNPGPSSYLVTSRDSPSLASPTGERESNDHEDELESSEDESDMRKAFGDLSLHFPTHRIQNRYLGKSSNVTILRQAVEAKYAYVNDVQPGSQAFEEPLIQEELALREKVRLLTSTLKSGSKGPCSDCVIRHQGSLSCLCPNSCIMHPWTQPIFHPPPPIFTFPEPDLLCSLVELYFEHCNIYLPVLHRPFFFAAVADGLHRRNSEFGSLVLLVCALGARYSEDRRVLLEKDEDGDGARVEVVDDDDGESSGNESDDKDDNEAYAAHTEEKDVYGWHSAGWKWFKQVKLGCRVLATPPSLYDLQICCLASVYFRGTSAPEAARSMTGMGLRLAQDLGLHRKKSYGNAPREEDELLKRTFWCLVWLEWTLSPALGRPCGIQYEDFDLDYPAECDDEYWLTVDPNLAFKQPCGKPSFMAYFNSVLKLNQINAFAHRTIYSSNKSKSLLGFMGPQWEQQIVAELDSALNSWLDSVPQHLRWDPQNPDPIFFQQSACLYSFYYSLQITIHRPFIPSPRKPSRIPFPSLAICTSAARSCVHVLDAVFKRSGSGYVMHFCTLPLFMSCIVLMLNMWGSGSPVTQGTMKEMEDIYRVMDILKGLEERLHLAGRLWDMLYELALVGELPLARRGVSSAVVTCRKQAAAVTVGGPSSTTRRSDSSGTSRRLKRKDSVSILFPVSVMLPPCSTSLPVRTTELGRQPLHPVYDTDPAASNTYDMSPSVFSSQSTVSSAPHADSGTDNPDSALDSIFTAERPRRSGSNSHIYAPTATHPHNPVFDPPQYTSAANQSRPPFQPQTQPEPQPQPQFQSEPSSQVASSLTRTSSFPMSYSILDEPQSFTQDPNNDTLAMWSNAPEGFQMQDWGAYINGLPEGNGNIFSQPTVQDGTSNSNNLSKVFTFYDTPL